LLLTVTLTSYRMMYIILSLYHLFNLIGSKTPYRWHFLCLFHRSESYNMIQSLYVAVHLLSRYYNQKKALMISVLKILLRIYFGISIDVPIIILIVLSSITIDIVPFICSGISFATHLIRIIEYPAFVKMSCT